MKKRLILFAVIAVAIVAILIFVLAGRDRGPSLTDVQMMLPADKTEYLVDEKFDPAGIVLIAVYSDGSRQQVKDYTWDKTGPLTKEDTVVKIKCLDRTFDQKISVVTMDEKILLTLANGVDAVLLRGDGYIKLRRGGDRDGGNIPETETQWYWDGENLRIWLTEWTGGVDGVKKEKMKEMQVEKDELGNYYFEYFLMGRWKMHYFVTYKEWSKVLTPEARFGKLPDPERVYSDSEE